MLQPLRPYLSLLILIKETGELNASELQAMVMDVNQNEVPPEDILSNGVYYYDGTEQTLSLATSREETAELVKRLQQSADFSQLENEHDMDQEL